MSISPPPTLIRRPWPHNPLQDVVQRLLTLTTGAPPSSAPRIKNTSRISLSSAITRSYTAATQASSSALCVDANDNELAYLEAIHFFVEVLDSFFGNVCELDLVFNFYKVSFSCAGSGGVGKR